MILLLNFQTIKKKINGLIFPNLYLMLENLSLLNFQKNMYFYYNRFNYSIQTCLPSLHPLQHFEHVLQQL